MTYVLLGGAALLALFAAYRYLRLDPRLLKRSLRWVVGGGAALVAAFLLIARRFDLAVFAGAAAFSVLRTGRLGPFSFENLGSPTSGNLSKVRSRYFDMVLDHDTGAVEGRVLTGRFAGADLIDLGEAETRALIAEVGTDADSLTLLESWLDANRAGWREYFAETAADGGNGSSDAPPAGSLQEAYDVLGLQPGATAEEIKSAHRELMKAVHPDHGGSAYLAAKINQARDLLLREVKRS